MMKRMIIPSLLLFAQIAGAQTNSTMVNPPFGLIWGESKATIQALGISLIPENLIVANGASQVYLASVVPNSIYGGAIYKFSFNANNGLSIFAIIVPNVSANDFKGIEAKMNQQYGDETYSKSGATKSGEIYNYLNWGKSATGNVILTYLTTENVLQMTYFAPGQIQ